MKAALIALLAACALCGEDKQPTPPKPPDQATPPPFIVHNPDGTFTIQKMPVVDEKDASARKGLVIKPQVVIPFVPAKKTPATS